MMESTELSASSRWLTPANTLTALRLLSTFPFVLAVRADSPLPASLIFAFAAASDFADGASRAGAADLASAVPRSCGRRRSSAPAPPGFDRRASDLVGATDRPRLPAVRARLEVDALARSPGERPRPLERHRVLRDRCGPRGA
jgi:hypothetical protein